MHHSLANSSWTSLLPIVAAVGFGLYRRTRRMVGFQRFRGRSPWARIGLYAVVSAIVLAGSYAQPLGLAAAAAGIAVGIYLAYRAIATTRFEERERGLYYQPNAWIGATLLGLFVIRLIYRLYLVYQLQGTLAGGGASEMAGGIVSHGAYSGGMYGTAANPFVVNGTLHLHPLTTLLYFTLVAYNAAYALLLFRHPTVTAHLSQSSPTSSS